MARNSRFGLQNLRDGIDEKTDELSSSADVRSVDGSNVRRDKPFTYQTDDYDRTEAPKDEMRQYWRQFESTPVVRKPITSFASRVTEPGYYIESEGLDTKQVRELGEWLDQCAIIERQPGKDFRLLAKKAIVQREVRGTALIEKAPHKENDNKIAGLKLINPETTEAVSHPQKSVLMHPDGLDEFDDAPEAESGGAAAWLQDTVETNNIHFGREMSSTDNDGKIGWTRDEVIPLTRDADVGEVFGTSRIEAVSDRIQGLKQKLKDNDEAIASKAYPLQLFLFGDPDSDAGVWDSDDINSFMSAHEMENFEPGMKQGMRGDVELETVSGEVAEIAEYLNFDIQWIMASMPMPLFLLGSFQEGATVGQVSGVAQQQDVIRQIEEARRELEEEFTPVVRQVARQNGVDEDKLSSIKLRFGEPGQPDPEVTRSQQVIRYVSDAQGGETQEPGQGTPQQQARGGGQQQRQQQQQDSDEKTPDGVIQKGETPNSVRNPAPDQQIAGVDTDGNPFVDMVKGEREGQASATQYTGMWDEPTAAALEEVVTADQESREQLTGDITEFFLTLRDRTLETVEKRYTSSPEQAATEFENVANRQLNRSIQATGLPQQARAIVRDELETVVETYGESTIGFTDQQQVKYYTQNIRNAVRDTGEELLRRARKLVRDSVMHGDSWDTVRERVEKTYNEDMIRDRARSIAHMELHNAVETAKLTQFHDDADIVGVQVTNPDASTPLTQSLDGATAYFEDGPLDEQLSARVDASALRTGFTPLPRTPPYHFNDTTVLTPLYDTPE